MSQAIGSAVHFIQSLAPTTPWAIVGAQPNKAQRILTFIPNTAAEISAAAHFLSDLERGALVPHLSLLQPLYRIEGTKLLTSALDTGAVSYVGVSLAPDKFDALCTFTPAAAVIVKGAREIAAIWKFAWPQSMAISDETERRIVDLLAAAGASARPLRYLVPIPPLCGYTLARFIKDAPVLPTDFVRRAPAAPAQSPMLRASDIRQEALEWLWPQVLPCGSFSIVAGAPAVGKSQLAASIAAIVTRGGKWPGTNVTAEKGGVIFWEVEDPLQTVTLPRLEAAGADLHRIIVPRSRCDLSSDLEALEAASRELGEAPRLLVLSPVRVFFGDRETYNGNELRVQLEPVCQWAAQKNVTILGVSHPKGDNEDFAGSRVWKQVARAGLFVRKTDGVREVWPLKTNHGPDAWRQAFQIEGFSTEAGIETSRVVWIEPQADISIGRYDTASAPASAPRNAKEWLSHHLRELAETNAGDELFLASNIVKAAKAANYSQATLYRAADALEKAGLLHRSARGFGQPATWRLVGDLVAA